MADDATDSLGNIWRARDIAGKKYPAPGGLLAEAIVANRATIGTTEIQLPSAVARRFHVRALPTNTGVIYLGGPGVTVSTGWALAGGDVYSFPIEVSNLSVVRAIADTAGQDLQYFGEV